MNQEIIASLEKVNIKPTPMRMLVLEQFYLHRKSLSLVQIEEFLYPSDRVTIYRSLQLFLKSGLIHKVKNVKDGAVYALCNTDCFSGIHIDNHPHFTCEICNEIICVEDFTYSIYKQKSAHLYTITSVDVSITGICPLCK